jgi:hypothetical protein
LKNEDETRQLHIGVSVNLTETQKGAWLEATQHWNLKNSVAIRKLVQFYLNKSFPDLRDILRQHYKIRHEQESERENYESRNARLYTRLTADEKHKLDILADEWFTYPSVIIRIFLEFLIAGFVNSSDIWG